MSSPYLNDFVFQPASAEQHEAAIHQVRQILGRRHGFDAEDKDALGIWDTVETYRSISTLYLSIKILLGVVGAITLSVGGVGVVNIMLVAVRQRINEIGVRRAVGAKRRHIFVQFFVESLLITVTGGIAGAATGVGLCKLIAGMSLPDGFAPPTVSMGIVLAAAAVLGGVAILSGLIPAYRAASTSPQASIRQSAATVG